MLKMIPLWVTNFISFSCLLSVPCAETKYDAANVDKQIWKHPMIRLCPARRGRKDLPVDAAKPSFLKALTDCNTSHSCLEPCRSVPVVTRRRRCIFNHNRELLILEWQADCKVFRGTLANRLCRSFTTSVRTQIAAKSSMLSEHGVLVCFTVRNMHYLGSPAFLGVHRRHGRLLWNRNMHYSKV